MLGASLLLWCLESAENKDNETKRRKSWTVDLCRTFVKGAAAAASGSFTFGPGLFDGGRASAQSVQADGSVQGARPNILVIKVDQLRFPSVFPPGINSVGDFLKQFMPNLYQLWQNGVKFAGHYTAACACTPARGTIITGLYSQQSWLVQTITAAPGQPVSAQPWLNPAYPTYGKLLRRVGYQTPYIGKWHVSIPRQDTPRLEEYGFDGLTWPDPTGANLQGTYRRRHQLLHRSYQRSTRIYAPYLNDADIATQGAQWLQQNGAGEAAPWCLTVSFVNPHDKEFFWAGTEFQTYNQTVQCAVDTTSRSPTTRTTTRTVLNNPPLVPWDRTRSRARRRSATRPSRPTGSRRDRSRRTSRPRRPSAACSRRRSGAASRTTPPSRASPSTRIPPTRTTPDLQDTGKLVRALGVGKAPFSYWQRSLDSYTQIMTVVDGPIGRC